LLPLRPCVAGGRVFFIDPSIDNVLGRPGGARRSDKEDPGSLQPPGESFATVPDWLEAWHDEDKDGRSYVQYGVAVGPPIQTVRQPVDPGCGYDHLLSLCMAALPEMLQLLGVLECDTIQLDRVTPDTLREALYPMGTNVLIAPMKKRQRSEEKVENDYDGDWALVFNAAVGRVHLLRPLAGKRLQRHIAALVAVLRPQLVERHKAEAVEQLAVAVNEMLVRRTGLRSRTYSPACTTAASPSAGCRSWFGRCTGSRPWRRKAVGRRR
jgi:hypothetical protein